ncbi:MAG TPA: GTPase domain-containing protein [Polyangiaceae bacterium]|nr:GTPase domain-containing protein [Polyangiaceae bacterium]
MAFFDPERRCLTLRLVYDGLGTAGKTTNVRQAHALFTLARRGEVFAPAEERGRTLFFDWLELESGFVDEWPLRCQVLSVPGQFFYVQRRYELLRSADAVVLVCDSSPAGVLRSRYAYCFLRRMMQEGGGAPVPIIVQANKQDMPGALPGPALAAELGLEPGVRVVEASAATGEGVRATLVFALQAARDELRARLDRDGLAALPAKRETAEEVYAHLLRHEDADEGVLLADSVIATLLAERSPAGVEGPDPDPAAPGPRPPGAKGGGRPEADPNAGGRRGRRGGRGAA